MEIKFKKLKPILEWTSKPCLFTALDERGWQGVTLLCSFTECANAYHKSHTILGEGLCPQYTSMVIAFMVLKSPLNNTVS